MYVSLTVLYYLSLCVGASDERRLPGVHGHLPRLLRYIPGGAHARCVQVSCSCDGSRGGSYIICIHINALYGSDSNSLERYLRHIHIINMLPYLSLSYIQSKLQPPGATAHPGKHEEPPASCQRRLLPYIPAGLQTHHTGK